MIKKRHSHNSVITRKGKVNRQKAVYKKEFLAHQIPIKQGKSLMRMKSEGKNTNFNAEETVPSIF